MALIITVHPRVGGEHAYASTASGSCAIAKRFIPAWAGNTVRGPRAQVRSALATVHPRVGGEHLEWA